MATNSSPHSPGSPVSADDSHSLRHLVSSKLRGIRSRITASQLAPQDRVVLVSRYVLQAVHLYPQVSLTRHMLCELTEPPKVMRGLRDLVVRAGTSADIAALGPIGDEGDNADEALLQRRFGRGDLLYVGQLGGNLLCQCWFHRGPTPFEEDGATMASWQLEPGAFWSYDAATTAAARATGVFVKVFQTALRELFLTHGARRVQCRVRSDNTTSLSLHDRLGFHRLGTVTVLKTPLARLVRFHGPAGVRRWLVPGTETLSLAVPPQAPPPGWGRA